MGESGNPFDREADHWERVIEEMETTAEHYSTAGWRTVELHPGDVTTLLPGDDEADDDEVDDDGTDDGEADGYVGLGVVVPDDEFETLAAHVNDRTFDSYEVLRAEAEGIVFLVTVLDDDAGDVAVFVPAYYDADDEDALRAVAVDHGALFTHVRRIHTDETITFEHRDPEPFFPAADDKDGDAVGENQAADGENGVDAEDGATSE